MRGLPVASSRRPPPASVLMANSAFATQGWSAMSFVVTIPVSSSPTKANTRSRDGCMFPGAKAQDRGHQRSDARLVVRGAATVENAILLEQRERIALPVFRTRIDDVHVRRKQDRPAASLPRHAHDHRLRLARIECRDVGRGNARPCQHVRQVGNHRRNLLLAFGRAEPDDARVDLAGLGFVRWCVGHGGHRRQRHGHHRQDQSRHSCLPGLDDREHT